ncbi:MAG: T9SS type A sorting domain-containing protein [Candidatus Eisenbacteria bacterium]|nr:T9SS type A sorting domain-containing protein [Candidatus Eisenbacteria bacterium]
MLERLHSAQLRLASTVSGLAALLAAPALAVQPMTAQTDLVATPGIALSSADLTPVDLATAESALERFAKETNTRWRALDWAPSSLTPRVAYGTGYDLGRAVHGAIAAEAAARDFVRTEPDLFRTAENRLTRFRAQAARGKWSVHFFEQVDGMIILGSKVTVMMTEAGRIAAFGATTFPMIERAAAPVLTPDAAAERALAHLVAGGFLDAGAVLERRAIEGPYLLPVLAGGSPTAPGSAGVEGHTIFRVALATHQPAAAFEVDVDAVDGMVLQRRDILRPLDVTGSSTGIYEDPGYCDGAATAATARLFLNVDGVGAATTGVDGSFTLPYGGSDPRPITAELRGPVVDINNVAGPQAAFSGTITPGVPFLLHWDDTNSAADERDTYYHVEGTHRLLKSIDPTWTDLDFPLTANVNLQQGCNAFWDGSSINMFHEQGGCANTGRIGDVVAHEYGHGITDYLYGPSDPPSDLHEGNSDIIGTFRANNPVVGPGFYLGDCVNGIRNLDNDLRYPDDLGGEGHHDGQIVGGFMWDTRERLINQLGYEAGFTLALELWHASRVLGLPYTQPEQVLWTLLADDDDANLDSGTPHYDAICPSAEHHGFSCPERFEAVVIHHTPLEYGVSPNATPIPVDAEMYSLDAPLLGDSLFVYWRSGVMGSFARVPLSPLGGESYRGFIPGQPVGQGVDYYIVAQDQLGSTLRRPASGNYTFTVAFAFDAFETAGGWTSGAGGDNATTGLWERVDPIGTKLGPNHLQPENDATPDPGVEAWITGQYTGGGAWLSDADGTTTLLSPIYDLTGMTWAVVRYDRWFQTLSDPQGALEIGISYNGGISWNPIEQVSGMQSPPSWVSISRTVTPIFGNLGLTRFRFVMKGKPLPSVDEAGIDDFALLADDQGSPSDAPEGALPVGELALRLASPNPTSSFATLEFSLPRISAATLTLYSVSGQRVRTLLRGEAPAGARRVEWDGRDESGIKVASGVYFARLHTADGEVTRRILIAR